MTSPARQVEVGCPRCGVRYSTWYRASINLGLGEEWSEADLREASSATCPACGQVVELETLVVSGDVWRLS
jgi:predicted RNA-binding Zn-ribbon protein involved in translation (DUF1610 family)